MPRAGIPAQATAVARDSQASLFSLRWVFVSYFAISGGIVLAVAGMIWVMQHEAVDPRLAAYTACGAGALIGGFFSGRASRHFSILEPGLGGALTVGAVYAMIRWTAIGPLAFAFAAREITRESLVLGGLAFGGGLSGALIGELTWRDEPSSNALRWLGMTALLTIGALLLALIATSVGYADQTLRDPTRLAEIWRQRSVPMSEDDLAVALLIVLGAGGLLGGLSTQLAAPVRMLIVIMIGAFGTISGILLGTLQWARALDAEALRSALLLAGGAAILGLVGAGLAWGIRRLLSS